MWIDFEGVEKLISTYPLLPRMAVKSEMLYMMAMAKGNAVQKPTTTIPTVTRGTTLRGLFASSARWRAPSRPPNMKKQGSNPIIKHTPSGHPVSLMKEVQTNSFVALGDDLTRSPTKSDTKMVIDRATKLFGTSASRDYYLMGMWLARQGSVA